MAENQKFEEIIKKRMEEFFTHNPGRAAYLGKEEYEMEVEPGTEGHIKENLKRFSQWIDELKQLDIEELNFENQISLKAMEY